VEENISPVAPMQRARVVSHQHYAQKSIAAVDGARVKTVRSWNNKYDL
jgi:hypothetical protein